MKADEEFYLVMYDITYSKTLQKIGKIMLKEGFERINYSVWVGWINPVKKNDLKVKLSKMLGDENAKGSVFYIMPISKSSLKHTRCLNGRKPKELDFWIGEKREAFF